MRETLPIRKRLRIKDYDYTKENMYFITICIKDRLELLGQIKENYIELTREGNITNQNINKIGIIYNNVIIDEYVIMPNHMHMILIINRKNENSISRIIKQLKRYISKEVGYSIWQKSFYEHIIRNEQEYIKIKEYIKNNIMNWKEDKYF